jgi:hypothetical protein
MNSKCTAPPQGGLDDDNDNFTSSPSPLSVCSLPHPSPLPFPPFQTANTIRVECQYSQTYGAIAAALLTQQNNKTGVNSLHITFSHTADSKHITSELKSAVARHTTVTECSTATKSNVSSVTSLETRQSALGFLMEMPLLSWRRYMSFHFRIQ